MSAGAFVVIILLLLFFRPYPELDQFLTRESSVVIYDRNNTVVQITPLEGGLRREFTVFSSIPDSIKVAFIKAEDGRFYSHHGIDFRSVLRAMAQNIRRGRRISGASTITMQLARIVSPSEKRNWTAKFRDVYNALRLERYLSKDQILEQYLNSVPFGSNVEGITSASWFFFGKKLNNLTDIEAAALAVIPRSPSVYNLFEHPEKCAKIVSIIYGYSYDEVLAVLSDRKPGNWPFNMPHLVAYVQKQSGDTFGHEIRELYLTADLDIQNYLKQQIFEAMGKTEKSRIDNAAALVIENKTGKVLAWVGSNDWYDREHSGQIDGVLVHNQMGSSMKPFLYALAIDKGLPVNSILPDIPMSFGTDTAYIPANFNNRFNGPVRLRNALASSLNIPAVYILNKVGVSDYFRCLLDLGFESLREDGLKADLGLALGVGEVSLLELTEAFSIFPRDGLYLPARVLEDGIDIDNSRQIFSPDTSRIICSILSDKKARVAGFGFHQTFETEYPSIFKTGTANQYQNIVALGATPEYTIGVWMGNFSGNTVMGKTGSSLPASIAKHVLDYIVVNRNIPFELPDNYEEMQICPVSGKCPGKYCPVITKEFVSKNSESAFKESICDWHVLGKGKTEVMFPAEYQKWHSADFKNSSIDFTSTALRIVSPASGSLFFSDQSSNWNQQLSVEVIGGKNSNDLLTVILDDKETCKVERPFIFNIPVSVGVHSLYVFLGDESDSITFTVE